MTPRLILGSASPRRRELLASIGLVPADIRPCDIDETPRRGELARPYCSRMAVEKAAALSLADGEVGLTADTTVTLGRRIMGKPVDRDEARRFLNALSGRRHRVITALAVRDGDRLRCRDVVTTLKMRPLDAVEIETYLDSDEWQGKAGGYGIQGRAAAFIPWLQGSWSAVVGLPLSETATLLRSAGIVPGPQQETTP
ncbi:MAG: septum formation protein Maf [Confluentimicrobium sp.]|nr:septum formation protein Maf [Actibacterium sp.]MBF51507.1 septum formation protein Maf [Actibacterium sp.]OWU71235.1 septum formation protein Maf [Roseovarius sp. 22II1-1F6A]